MRDMPLAEDLLSIDGDQSRQFDELAANRSNKLWLDQTINHSSLKSTPQQLLDRLAAPGTKVEGPVVDVHAHELVGLLPIQSAPEPQGVINRCVAMFQPVLDALVQQ